MRSLRTLLPRNEAPVPYTGRRAGGTVFGGNSGGSSPADQLKAMQRNGTLYAIVDATSTAVAAVEWGLYRTPKAGEPVTDDTREQVNVHAAWALWNQPNPYMTRHELVETVQQHIELTGIGYLIVVKHGNIPIELWFARPDRMTPVPSPTDYLTGWIYTTPDGEKIPFPADEVVAIRKPNPLDPYAGSSPVSAISTDLDAAQYAASYNRAFFENSAEPGGILSVDGSLNDDQFNQLVTRWGEQHRGVARAHRVAVVEHGMKYTARQVTQRDMQFSELRSASRDVIMEPYRISKTTLGISDDVNLANAKAAEYQFARNLTVPRLSRWREALNHRLLPMFGTTGKGVEFDFVSPVREDEDAENAERTSRAQAAATLVTANFDRAATLAWAGLPPELAGETVDPKAELLTKLVIGAPSLAPLLLPLLGFDLPAPPGPAAPPAPTPAQDKAAAGPGDGQPAPAATALAPGGGPHHTDGHVHAADNPDDPDLTHLQVAWRAALDRLLDQWTAITADQRAELRAQIIDAVDAGQLEALAAMHADSTAAAARLTDALEALAKVAAAQAVDEAVAQGVDELTPTIPVGLSAVAATVAALLAADLAVAAGREALRIVTPDSTGEQVATAVVTELAQRSAAGTEAQLGGALTGAQNRARVETMASGPVGSLYATEVNDRNRCAPCSAVDGRFICTTEDLGPYERLYTAMGGYVGCLGGVRCRGSVTGVWRPQTVDGPGGGS